MQAPDYEPGAPPVFVLRYKTWVDKFSADPNILNKTFVLNDVPRTLIGVMPPRFGWGDSEVWIPEKPSRAAGLQQNGFPRFWFLMGHLKPGISIREAESDFQVIAHRLATKYPKDYPKHFSVEVHSLTDLVVGQFRTTLYIVLAAVGLLLLIGCGNVANLLLARATVGRIEIAGRGDAERNYSGGSGDPAEWTRADVYAMRGRLDRADFWLGAGAAGSAT